MTFIPLSRLMIEGRPAAHPVAIQNGKLIDFVQFAKDVGQIASRFSGQKRALLICHDTYNFAVGLMGLLHAGTEIVLPPNRQSGTINSLQQEYDLLVDDSVVKTVDGETIRLSPINPDRLSLHFYTSGSTGSPKIVSKNLGMLEREVETLNRLWNEPPSNVFATVSHQHIYGLTFKVLWPLMAGPTFVSETYISWDDLIPALTRGATIISSPAHLGRLEGIAPISSEQSPKQIFSAGSMLPFSANEQARKIFGCRPTEIFGSTETGAFATRSQQKEDEPWHLLPGVAMRCDSENKLNLCSPFIGSDWIETEDLVEPLSGGFRHLGRADRIAKIEGKRVSLIEIERALESLPDIKSAAVVILDGNPTQLAAAIALTNTGLESLKKVGNFRFSRLLRDNLMPNHESASIPRLWRFMEELPTQGLGKRRDADIRALFGHKQ